MWRYAHQRGCACCGGHGGCLRVSQNPPIKMSLHYNHCNSFNFCRSPSIMSPLFTTESPNLQLRLVDHTSMHIVVINECIYIIIIMNFFYLSSNWSDSACVKVRKRCGIFEQVQESSYKDVIYLSMTWYQLGNMQRMW